ncbi:hypothetical protein [Rubellimicrobium mesophilum]|uniref:hypothetical protein n=1 Tax=Rubellimicrobium mesophilum TaxID=1123067 RepID=UPI0012E23E1C|nr:hypothetical protein [Rubellimicrobium mesophilum]
MTDFSTARTRAMLDLYQFAASRRDQLSADIGEHALGLALSERRPDPFLARSAIRNARCTVLRRLRRDVARRAELSRTDGPPDGSFDAVMANDTISAMARPPSPERALIMRGALKMLLNKVKKQLGDQGVEVASRYLDPIDEVATNLGCSTAQIKRLRADVRSIAEQLADEVRP